jgi:preprotein translocase subunit SecE
MAKAAKAKVKQVGRQDNRLVRFLKETRTEIKKVAWPTRKQAINLTFIVIGVTAAMSLFLGVLDFLLQRALNLVV